MWECVRQKSIFADQEGERMGNRKRLNANQDIFLLILGIAWANLIFFHQENWKMDPWKVGIRPGHLFLYQMAWGKERSLKR